MRRIRASLAAAAVLGLPTVAAGLPIDIDGPTTGWTPVVHPSSAPDWPDDQATAIPGADIVGDPSHPAFYTAFDGAGSAALTDGMLGFRIRLGADPNPAGFGHVAAVGIDANLDGALDVFVVVRNNINPDRLAIFDPGAGARTSPSTTTVTSTGPIYAETTGSNYDWSPVSVAIDPSATLFDLDGDGAVDHFLSFAVPLQDLVNRLAILGVPNVDENTPFQYVLGTANQVGSLNQDLAGPNGGTNSSSTWDALGATSLALSPNATPIPEPGTAFLMGLGLFGLGLSGRRFTPR